MTHEWSCPMQILFNKTMHQCRLLGARGGRTHARYLRLRKLQSRLPVQSAVPVLQTRPEHVHEASLSLDRQFPWLAVAFISRADRSQRTRPPESNLASRPPGNSAGDRFERQQLSDN